MAYHNKKSKKIKNVYNYKSDDKYNLCKSCIYRSRPEHEWNCDYISFVGHSRGCEPGNECIEYKKGARLKVNNNNIFIS